MVNDALKKKISDWIDAHEKELFEDMARLVAIKSVKTDPEPDAPFGAGPLKALEEALKLCEERGFETKNYDNRVGAADLGPAPAVIDILGHLDVVGEGALDGWDTDPYTLTIKDDGCAYGRGTADDKGPVVTALYAMMCLRDLGLPLKQGVRLIMGTDEESGMQDLPAYYAVNKPAPNTVSPDADFPVYNTEKGHYQPSFKCEFEKTDARPAVLSIDGGYRLNVLPADASAVIAGVSVDEVKGCAEKLAPGLKVSVDVKPQDGNVLLAVKGVNSHASLPEDGVNGITALIEILLALPLADCGGTKAMRGLHEMFPHGDDRGRALGIAQSDDISGDLTVAFSLLTMTEDGITGRFDSRTSVCANDENCRKIVEKAFAARGFSIEGKMEPPHHTPAGTPFINTLLSSYEGFTGLKGECLAMGGGTYVHHVEGGVAFGTMMPGFNPNMHSQNEHCSIKDTLTAAKIYAAVLAEMCC